MVVAIQFNLYHTILKIQIECLMLNCYIPSFTGDHILSVFCPFHQFHNSNKKNIYKVSEKHSVYFRSVLINDGRYYTVDFWPIAQQQENMFCEESLVLDEETCGELSFCSDCEPCLGKSSKRVTSWFVCVEL